MNPFKRLCAELPPALADKLTSAAETETRKAPPEDRYFVRPLVEKALTLGVDAATKDKKIALPASLLHLDALVIEVGEWRRGEKARTQRNQPEGTGNLR